MELTTKSLFTRAVAVLLTAVLLAPAPVLAQVAVSTGNDSSNDSSTDSGSSTGGSTGSGSYYRNDGYNNYNRNSQYGSNYNQYGSNYNRSGTGTYGTSSYNRSGTGTYGTSRSGTSGYSGGSTSRFGGSGGIGSRGSQSEGSGILGGEDSVIRRLGEPEGEVGVEVLGAVDAESPIRIIGAGAEGGVRVQAAGAFEPARRKAIQYQDVPDIGEPMSFTGPMAVSEFLDNMQVATNWNILSTPEAEAMQLLFRIVDVKPAKAMEILQFHDIYYEYDAPSNFLYVMTKDQYLDREYGDIDQAEFRIEHAILTDIETILQSLLSPQGSMIVNARTNDIVIRDTADNLAAMREAVARFDIQQDSETFELKHVDVNTVVDSIEAMLSERGVGYVDTRFNTITIVDLPEKRMRIGSLLDRLDKNLESETFALKHVGVEGLKSTIESMLSSRGLVFADSRFNLLVVTDLPEERRRIGEMIRLLDRPMGSETFRLKHLDVATVEETVESMLSERGVVYVDPRYNMLMVTDLPERREEIGKILREVDSSLDTRTWTISFADASDIAERIEQLVPGEMGRIVFNEDVHQLTVTAMPERLDTIDGLIKTWDIRRKQVHIEAYMIEVNEKVSQHLGANWSYLNTAEHVINGPYSATTLSPTSPDTTFRVLAQEITPWREVKFQLDFLVSQGDATVLSHPRVTVQDGQEAVFDSSERIPYVESMETDYSTNTNYPTRDRRKVVFLNVGITLSVMPRISDDNMVLLDIDATESVLVQFEELGTQDDPQKVPRERQNRASTQVRVGDGQTIVIGGLRKGRYDGAVDKVPVLGDVPVLKHIFRKQSTDAERADLLIFITSTMVDEATGPEARFLAKADSTIDEKLRWGGQTFWGILEDYISQGAHEIVVDIGQHGDLQVLNEATTLKDIRTIVFNERKWRRFDLREGIVRFHSRAPEEVVEEVRSIMLEAGLKVTMREQLDVFVPPQPDSEPVPAT